ncbi:MAG: chromosomal replication initiator protein DnaA [Anaerolineales bacterium]
MNAERHWQAALGQLQMEMPRAAYDTWVRDAEFIAYEDGNFIIGVQNAYARDWLEDRLLSTAKRVLTGILSRTVGVKFIVWQGDSSVDDPLEPALDPPELCDDRDRLASSINNRYTFETFVVGKGNRLAHAAAQAVAESPAKAYNPLFLYGGVGLGKTHLLHAIGHECLDAGLQVRYVSSEEFTNDLVDAIRSRNTAVFRERYRRVDVLLIDDIQFIAGKEATQEEFFHTFNTLHGQEKQVVISSDRSPKAFVTLEERLRSRFEWGLTADIHAPDYETRLAILRSRAERLGREAPDEILSEIAERVQSNIRELEGALTRVLAYADLRCEILTPNLVDAALADMVVHTSSVTTEQIISVVADQYGIEESRLLSRERSREVAFPRQIAMYLIREETSSSLPKIGEALGGRDHTTVMYGCGKIADQLEIDDALRRQVVALRDRIYSH